MIKYKLHRIKSKIGLISLLLFISIHLNTNLCGQETSNDWENSEIFGINKEEAHNTAILLETFEEAKDADWKLKYSKKDKKFICEV